MVRVWEVISRFAEFVAVVEGFLAPVWGFKSFRGSCMVVEGGLGESVIEGGES